MWHSSGAKPRKVNRRIGFIVIIISILCSPEFARAVDQSTLMGRAFDSLTASDVTPALCDKLLKPLSEADGGASSAAGRAYRRLCRPGAIALKASTAPAQTLSARDSPIVPSSLIHSFLDPKTRVIFVSRDSLSTLGEFAADSKNSHVASPLGATVSATFDQLKATQQVSGQGYLGFCAVCGTPVFSGDATFSIGPAFIYDGSLTLPLPAKPPLPDSAVRMGPDLALDAAIPFTDGGVYADALPFFQTDFRGEARMYGLQFLAEPYDKDLSLRIDVNERSPRALGFIWRVIPEADVVNVSNPGLTNYVNGVYDFMGGNVQATLTPFVDMTTTTPTEAFLNRFSLVFTYKYLVNAADSKNTVSNFQAELDYKLGADASEVNGGPSISLAYATGTDILTMLNQQQIKLSFAYKY